MKGWSKAKIDCYEDFKQQLMKEGLLVKKRKTAAPLVFTELEEGFFEAFWNSGIRRAGDKKKAKVKYIKTLRSNRQPMAFHLSLLEDIKQRVDREQLGFDKMHPYTYLNQERWKDDLPAKEVKLLQLPSPRDQQAIDKIVREYELPKATTEKDYFEYHATLKEYIEKHQIKPKGGDNE